MQEMPSISSSAYGSSSTSYTNMAMLAAGNTVGQNPVGHSQLVQALYQADPPPARSVARGKPVMTGEPKRRIVQVFIADSNENVPLDQSVVYKGEQKLTDATDQELFFEISINDLLKVHNEKRVTFRDKKVKERTEHLEPAKIRDLKMVVVTVAEF